MADESLQPCAYGNGTDAIMAYTVKKKGVSNRLPHAMSKDIEQFGYGGMKISMKSDQEKSFMSVKNAFAECRSMPTSMLESPAKESK